MPSIPYDIKDAWRGLTRSRGYAAAVVLTLGLGIGLNTAIFTVVDALLLKPLPYPEPDRLVRIAEWPSTGGNFTMSPAAFLEWRERTRSFTHLEARVGTVLAVRHGEQPEEVRGFRVTPGYFDLLGIRPAEGRTFTEAEARAEAACYAVVTRRFLTTRLGGDFSVGEPMRVNGRECLVIGVLPAGMVVDRQPVDVYLPLGFAPAHATNYGRGLTVLGRLRPGVEIDEARAEMIAIAAQFNARRGDAARGWTAALTPLRDVVIRADSRWLAGMLFATVASVLLVACLNVAGLSLSRTITRRRELAIRTALGASRWQTFRHLLVESLLLGFAGGLIGVLLGSWALRAFTALAPAGTLPPEAAVALDARALSFTALLSLAAGVLCGVAPGLRGASVRATEALTSNRSTGPSRAAGAVHKGLLVLEVSLAVVLVVAATSLTMSFVRLTRVDPGFSASQVLTTAVALPADRYSSGEAVARFYQATLEAFRRVPGVQQAAAVTSLPLGGWLYGTTFAVHGEAPSVEHPPSAHIQHVTDGYSDVLGLTLSDGRWFTSDDDARSPLVAIVNETFVRRFVPDRAAVGRHLRLGISTPRGAGALWEIVGVVRDVKAGGLADAALATPEIYVAHQQSPMSSMFLAVRVASGSPSRIIPDLRAAVRAEDPELPLGSILTMEERLGSSVDRERFRMAMMGSSAALALLLSCLGVYALRSQAVGARIREMGVRLAMGATGSQLLWMIVRQGMLQVGAGVTLGLVMSVWLTRFLEPWLFATRATEPRVLIAAAALFAIAALAASWMPARRAASVDPMSLLRVE